MRNKYKAVFIDWNGTLSKSEFFDHLKDFENSNSHLYDLLEHTLYTELWPTLAKPWMLGRLRTEDITQAISNKTGIPYDIVFREIILGSKKLAIDEDSLNLVAKIRERGVKVLIATGNVDAFDRWTVPALGLKNKFDGILNSYTLGVMKKDRDKDGTSLFFRGFLASNNILAEECVIIDDMKDKKGVMTSFGIKFVQLHLNTCLAVELSAILHEIEDN